MNVVDDTPHDGSKYRYNKGCRCDSCKAAVRAMAQDYYRRNKERINKRNLAYYYANHEEQKAKGRERSQRRDPASRRASVERWREKNPEYSWAKANPERARENARRYAATAKAREYHRRYREEHPELFKEAHRRWMERNPDRVALTRQRTRFKRKQAEYRTVLERDWQRLVKRYDGKCAYCGCAPDVITQDHVIPLSRGGWHAIGNLLPACKPCNSSKNARTIVEWRVSRLR